MLVKLKYTYVFYYEIKWKIIEKENIKKQYECWETVRKDDTDDTPIVLEELEKLRFKYYELGDNLYADDEFQPLFEATLQPVSFTDLEYIAYADSSIDTKDSIKSALQKVIKNIRTYEERGE